MVSANGQEYTFSKKTGYITSVKAASGVVSLTNGPRLVAVRRSDRSYDQFYNHDDKQAEKKKTQYTEYADQGEMAGFTWDENNHSLTVHYRHGSLDSVSYTFAEAGKVKVSADYNFNGVVDLMGLAIDYPEQKVKSKRWVGNGPYRVWQNRIDGPQYGYWQNDYNDPVPGESWDYPEFKGYFAGVSWMQLTTDEGLISISNPQASAAEHPYIGVYTPRDGRDHILYELTQTGLSVLPVIPAVRNKVNTTDLNGPSAQPHWLSGKGTISFVLKVE